MYEVGQSKASKTNGIFDEERIRNNAEVGRSSNVALLTNAEGWRCSVRGNLAYPVLSGAG
jgi:hypothetical protein